VYFKYIYSNRERERLAHPLFNRSRCIFIGTEAILLRVKENKTRSSCDVSVILFQSHTDIGKL
jgi:hypothetical protein